ncbi:NB-ARC and TPR domain protein [Aspergillus flavus]|nr:NB-ARC and TPR domain protein [Aspergillus flavus]RAQ69681.1 NB-ARC and TPR domain protein [Aspergillus flavus]
MGASSLSPTSRPRVWNIVRQRFKDSLHDETDLEICMETFSLDILLSQLKSVAKAHRNENFLLARLSRFRPSLVYLNDFMTVLVLPFALDGKTGALLWGGICLLLSTMLEELIAALPGIHPFGDNIILDEKLETAMVDLYTELALFCARAISFIRVRRQHLLPIRQSWPQLSREFQQGLKRVQMLSQQVERETQRAATTAALKWNNEMITLFQSLSTGHKHAGPELPCFHIPLTLNDRFYIREGLLDQISGTLNPKAGRSGPRALVLYGIGGAGKTQTALQYAYRAREQYDAVLWISADSTVKMAQDYMAVARRLGVLPETQETQDAFGAMAKMKSWLADTTCSWLLIFDNADNLEVLEYGWPNGVVGSILITTRDFNASLHPASQGLHVNVFDNKMGAKALQRLLGPSYDYPSNAPLIAELNEQLGGLPLALNQISNYIRQQKMDLKDFLILYRNNQEKLHKRRPAAFDYQHTIGTVWELALEKLTGNAAVLQRLLAFLDPEAIDEATLCNAASTLSKQASLTDSSLMFLADPIDFEDAKAELLRAALIDRDPRTKSISVHRLIQQVTLSGLSPVDKTRYFDLCCQLLCQAFPSSWTDQEHVWVYHAWKACEKCLRHVMFLAERFAQVEGGLKCLDTFIELLLRCSWYLYEAEYYEESLNLLQVCLQALERKGDTNSSRYAQAHNVTGLVQVDLRENNKALQSLKIALKIREKILPPTDWGIGVSISNVGFAYTEQGDLTQAMNYLQRSLEFRKAINCRMVDNSYANIASCLLRMGKPNEAEAMYTSVPDVRDLTDEQLLRENLPRYSSGMQLLSMLRQAQGRLDEALDFASKVLQFRRQKFGSRFKTCDSLCHVAKLMLLTKKSMAALQLLDECISVASSLPKAEGYLALAYFRKYKIYRAEGHADAAECLRDAIRAKEIVVGRLGSDYDSTLADDDEAAYTQLVAWLLW